MIKHTAHHTATPGEYAIKDANGKLLAMVGPTLVGGDNFFRVYWYGGKMHGKITITEGGMEGMMDVIAQEYS